MNYRFNLSDEARLEQQFEVFLETKMPLLAGMKKFQFFKMVLAMQKVAPLKMPPKIVLGKRAELFFKYATLQSQEYELIASGVQLIFEGVTQGELDFLLFSNVKKEVTHVELAYKFYLFDESAPAHLGTWVGPNRRDSLRRMFAKLGDNQFPKLYSASARKHLDKLSIDLGDVVEKLYFPMQLFVPFNNLSSILLKGSDGLEMKPSF